MTSNERWPQNYKSGITDHHRSDIPQFLSYEDQTQILKSFGWLPMADSIKILKAIEQQ